MNVDELPDLARLKAMNSKIAAIRRERDQITDRRLELDEQEACALAVAATTEDRAPRTIGEAMSGGPFARHVEPDAMFRSHQILCAIHDERRALADRESVLDDATGRALGDPPKPEVPA